MINPKLLKEIIKQAKKAEKEKQSFIPNICFIGNRWFWLGSNHTLMITDTIEDENIARQLDGKCIKLHEDIEKNLQTLQFTDELIEKYKISDEENSRQISVISNLFEELTSSPLVARETFNIHHNTLKNIRNCFVFFETKDKENIEISHTKTLLIFKSKNKYLFVSLLLTYK